MPNLLPASVALLVAALLSACATTRTATRDEAALPLVYSGTRLNVAALRGDAESLDRFTYYGVQAPEHPLLDLPLSLVADTGVLALLVAGAAYRSNFTIAGGQ
jgi:uncharacterized protein YceK